jgi:modulator of FtsH protease HflC
LEKEALDAINKKLADNGYGIKAVHLGIRRLLLPQTVTDKVFDRMTESRKRLAQNARSEGQAKATSIRSEANNAQKTILAFAERRAQAIRAEGDQAAIGYFDAFQKDQGFAIFLRQIDALKKVLSHNTTFILDAKDVTPMELLGKNNESALAPVEIKK